MRKIIVPTVSYTRGWDLSGSFEGAGGIGGLLGRSSGYSSSTGSWSTHNFYHADGNGNITYLVNSSQALAASYRYDSYGNLLSSSGTLASANLYRFSSKEFHPKTGFYYYGFRWYDPSLQRWLNRDPIGETACVNLYAFTCNSPTLRYDLMGLLTESERAKLCEDFAAKNPDQASRKGGSIVCVDGTPVPCLWGDKLNPGYDKIIRDCWLKHEQSHAEDATKDKWCDRCPNNSIPREAPEKIIRSECKAYRAMFDCLMAGTNNGEVQSIGWFKAIGEIQAYLRQHPGKCEKEFPGGRLPW